MATTAPLECVSPASSFAVVPAELGHHRAHVQTRLDNFGADQDTNSKLEDCSQVFHNDASLEYECDIVEQEGDSFEEYAEEELVRVFNIGAEDPFGRDWTKALARSTA